METEGESNNYGMVDLNIQFMGSYVGEVWFLDQERLTLYTFFMFDIFNINFEFSSQDLFVNWLLNDQLIFLFFFL